MIHQTINGEVIVINLDHGVYYSLQGLSAGIWESVQNGVSRPAIIAKVKEGFIDWYLRAVHVRLRVRLMPDLVLWRRLHDANLGILRRDTFTDYAHTVEAALDRRRAAGREG